MAELALGIGMSHSSLIATEDPKIWLAHEAIDRDHPYLRDKSGRQVTFDELEAEIGRPYEAEATLEHISEQVPRAHAAVGRLREAVAAHGIDVLVMLGDDQMELHDLSNMPALGVFYGAELVMGTRSRFRNYGVVGLDRSAWAAGYGMDAQHRWPGHARLAEHLITSLIGQHFDVTAMNEVPPSEDGVGLGHAFGVVETQLMDEQKLPLVPVFVNNYWPPNQVPPARCWQLGRALRMAIEAFPEDLRVAVVASGGLSHFITDEELDNRVLAAIRASDRDALCNLPVGRLNSGNSEIRNWIALAAVCEERQVAWDEYIPVYRTAAGTGVGLAFARWS